MTEQPPSAEQPTAREPGFYWIRRRLNWGSKRREGKWELWHCDKAGYWEAVPFMKGGWPERLQDFAEVGPRIPDAATLQQHERAMAVVEAARAFAECTEVNELGAERMLFDALRTHDAKEPTK
jgi:hypothetical protein